MSEHIPASVRPLGVALIAAPVLLLASTLAYITGNGFNGDDVGGAVQVYALAAMAVAMVAATRLLEDAMPRAATALLVVGLFGCAGGVAYGVDSIAVEHFGASLEAASTGVFVLQVLGLFFPLSWIGIGVATARTGVASAWAGYATALGGLLFPLSRIPRIEPLAVVADVLLIAGLAGLGVAVLQGRRGLRVTGQRTQGASA
jgi:hypothetical protein